MNNFLDLTEYYFEHDSNKMLKVVEPQQPLSLLNWLIDNRTIVENYLQEHGALLFRNFAINSASALQKIANTLTDELLDYSFRSTPRTKVGGKVYTSTEYPAQQTIPLHNENAYTNNWPEKIMFLCLIQPATGGETPIADSRKVFQRLSSATREKFMNKGVMYVRNYGGGLDLSWQEVFQTTDKAEVEEYCKQNAIKLQWQTNDRLRTWQVCPATWQDQNRQIISWFNQAHLFHFTSLDKEMQKYLLEDLNEDELPRNTYYGDGSPIEADVLTEINAAYAAESFQFPWQRGDLMLLDNRLFCHGRNPFTGERKIVVAMGN